jgi:hypothetical protein
MTNKSWIVSSLAKVYRFPDIWAMANCCNIESYRLTKIYEAVFNLNG